MSKQEEQIEGTQNTQDGAELSDADLEQAAGGCYWSGGVSVQPAPVEPPVFRLPPDIQPVQPGEPVDSGSSK